MESTSKKKKDPKSSDDIDDINLKLKYAKRVYIACEIEMRMNRVCDAMNNIHQRVTFYTESNPYLIYKAIKSVSSQIDFKDWLTQKRSGLITSTEYQHIRKIIIDSYINKGKVPTVVSLLDDMHNKVSTEAIKDFMISLRSKGFTWVRIPGTSKSVIVEKPEIVYKRMNYLLKMRKFREEGKNIIYIEEVNVFKVTTHNIMLDARMNSQTPLAVMAANKESFISLFFYDLSTENVMKSFLEDLVLPQVTESSVIVIGGDQDHHGETMCNTLPDENSFKHEMREWLDRNNVAHDPAMHRSDLLTLINRIKRGVRERNKLGEMLKDYGHEVIRRPEDLPMLNFFEKYLSALRDHQEILKQKQIGRTVVIQKYSCKLEMAKLKKTYSKVDFMKWEQQLAENEQKTYLEDLQMEDIIDRIMTMAKNDAVRKKDLEVDYDSQKLDDEFLSRLVIGPELL